MSKVIKEIAIMLGVCLLAMLALAVGLYHFVPSRKNVPEITTYVATSEIKDLLEDDIDTRAETKDPVLTYEVTSSELRSYQKANEYVPGKANPFAVYTPTVTGEEVGDGVEATGDGVEVSTGKTSENGSTITVVPKTTNTTNEVKTNMQSSSTK